MDRDQVWEAIGRERLSLADLLDELSAQEWETPSLCAGWRVRDVATDCAWSAGDGLLVEGPIATILLILTGRSAALSQLSGPGAAELGVRAGRSGFNGCGNLPTLSGREWQPLNELGAGGSGGQEG